MQPLMAIREFCINCAGSGKLVRVCKTQDCHLFPLRFGSEPAESPVIVEIFAPPPFLLLGWFEAGCAWTVWERHQSFQLVAESNGELVQVQSWPEAKFQFFVDGFHGFIKWKARDYKALPKPIPLDCLTL